MKRPIRSLLFAAALLGLLAFGIWRAAGRHRPGSLAFDPDAPLRTARNDADAAGRAAKVTTPAPSRPAPGDYRPATPILKSSKMGDATARPSRTPASALRPSDAATSPAGDATSPAGEADGEDSASDADPTDGLSGAAGTDATRSAASSNK